MFAAAIEHGLGLSTSPTHAHGGKLNVVRRPQAEVRDLPDLVVVAEADRLKTASLEQLRDFYDRRIVCRAVTAPGRPTSNFSVAGWHVTTLST